MKVVISGYYGFDNIGDEAILQSLIALLRSACKDIQIVVFSEDPPVTSERYGVRSVKRDSFTHVFKEIATASLFFNGGGGIIQDVTSRWSPLYYLSLWQAAHLFGKRSWVWGQGIGPLKSRLYWWWLKQLLRSTDVIGVRDVHSYDIIKSLGIDERRLYLSEDVVFAFSEIPTPQNHIDGPIAIVIRKWLGAEEFVNRLISKLKVLGKKLLIVSFSKGDEHFLREVGSKFEDVELLMPRSVGEAFRIISRVGVVVGMRLHSLIFSSLLSVPFVGVGYDPKVSLFCEKMEMNCFPISRASLDGIVMAVRRLYDGYDEYAARLLSKAESTRKRCVENFGVAWKRWRDETGISGDI